MSVLLAYTIWDTNMSQLSKFYILLFFLISKNKKQETKKNVFYY